MVSSRVREETVRKAAMASAANLDDSANTSAYIVSNSSSYLRRRYQAESPMGIVTHRATRASFQP